MKKCRFKILILFCLSFFLFFVYLEGHSDNTVLPRNRKLSKRNKIRDKEKYVRIRGGLKKMIELSDTQDQMQKELDKETASYKKMLDGLEKKHLKKGMYTTEILNKYGKPVVINKKLLNSKEWIYKPGYESYFSGKEIKLLFNKNGKLETWSFPKKIMLESKNKN